MHLASERIAGKFLSSVQHRPEFAEASVKVLHLGVALRIETAHRILDICLGIEDLTLQSLCHLQGVNPLLRPLQGLTHLRVLSINLSSIFNKRIIFLPNVEAFHRVTHLHISSAWAVWAGSSIGIAQLPNITHISLHLSTIRTQPAILRDILARDTTEALVLWRRTQVTYSKARRFLEDCGLVDRRIVVLDLYFDSHYNRDGGFWGYVERLIEWRASNDGELLLTSVRNPAHADR